MTVSGFESRVISSCHARGLNGLNDWNRRSLDRPQREQVLRVELNLRRERLEKGPGRITPDPCSQVF